MCFGWQLWICSHQLWLRSEIKLAWSVYELWSSPLNCAYLICILQPGSASLRVTLNKYDCTAVVFMSLCCLVSDQDIVGHWGRTLLYPIICILILSLVCNCPKLQSQHLLLYSRYMYRLICTGLLFHGLIVHGVISYVDVPSKYRSPFQCIVCNFAQSSEQLYVS